MIISTGISESDNGYLYNRIKGSLFWTLSYQVCGQNKKTVGKHTVTRRPPYVALTRPGTVYHVATTNSHTQYFEYWVSFAPKPEWSRLLAWPEEQQGAFHVHLETPDEALLLQCAFKDLNTFRRSVHPEKEALLHNTLERILLLIQNLRPSSKGRITDQRVQRAIDFLNDNFRNKIRFADIAAHVHVSPFHLAHLFKQNVGMSARHYVEMQRVETAKSLLLSTDDTIYAIAENVGYQNPYHFSTRFRRHTGMSPRVFRAQTIENLKGEVE